MVLEINRLIKYLAFIVIFSFLLPAFKIGGFGMKPDLIFLFPLLLLVLIRDTSIKKQSFFLKIFSISFLVFISMFLSDTFGVINYGNSSGAYFPTEYIHFVNKVLILYVFYVIGKNNIISNKAFSNVITVIFFSSLIFGLFQIIGISFITGLSDKYALTENQISKISSTNLRIFSVTGNILTWAGWSGFIFLYTVIIYKNSILKWVMLLLSLVNLLFTSSRGALIALAVSLLFYFMFKVYKTRKFSNLLKYIFISFISLFIIGWASFSFFEERTILFIDRFYFLNDAIFVSGRNTQLKNIKEVFDTDIWNYFIGIGKPVIDSIDLMEIEFLFILFGYGIVGVILQYSYVLLVLKKALLGLKTIYSELIIIGVLFYLIYSAGYFFLREIYSGLLFWAIIGYFLSKIDYGKYEK